jgi:glycosyltransferase involved in cell wall biosynthesis
VLAPRVNGHPPVVREDSLLVRRALPRTFLPQTVTDVAMTGLRSRGARGRVDLVVAHGSTVAVGLLAARLGAPLAYVYHASAPRELRDLRLRLDATADRLKTYPLAAPLVLYERLALAAARRVLVLSDFSRSLVEADHPQAAPRVRRVSGAVDVAAFSPGDGPDMARARLGSSEALLNPELPLLVTVRRLEPRMGLDRLVRAVSLLEPRRPVQLAIVGDGSLARELRSLVAELGLEHRVRLAGRVPDGEVQDWCRAADLFVLPTLAYEGFGMATLEALASGTPVVGTAIGATPELLEPLDPRLVARGAAPAELADAIEAALPLATAAFRDRCREYAVERFSWDTVIAGWEEALAEAAA